MFDTPVSNKFSLVKFKGGPKPEQLQVGDYVTLLFQSRDKRLQEPLLVQVSAVEAKRYECIVHERPDVLSHLLQQGDFVYFKPEHIQANT